MSYQDILERFDEIVIHHETKKEDIQNLSKLFSSYKKILENFSLQLSKLHSSAKPPSNQSNSQNSLSSGLLSLINHFHTLSESNLLLAKNLQIDIIEPLDLFFENYGSVHSELKLQGKSIVKPLKSAQNRVLKIRSEYYMASGDAEKAARHTITEDSKEKQEIAEKNEVKLISRAETQLSKYLEGLTQVNRLRDEFEQRIPKVMHNLQQNEESRVHFMKNTLEKYVRYYQKCENVNNLSIKKVQESFLDINPLADTQTFVGLFKAEELHQREKFVNYDEWKKGLNENEYEIMEKDPDIPTLIKLLLTGNISKCNPIMFSELSDLIVCSEGRLIFIDCLEASTVSNLAPENLEFLAKFIRGMLDQLVQKNEYDAYLFCKIIELSTRFFSHEAYKTSLSGLLCSHSIWRDEKRWSQSINYAVNTKMTLIKESQKGRVRTSLDEIVELESDGFESSSAYLLLSQFGFQLAKLNVPLAVARSVICSACDEYGISKEKQSLLLVELYSRAENAIKKPAKSKKGLKNLDFILLKAAKFLSLAELSSLTCVNKSLHCTLQSLSNRKIWTAAKKIDFKTVSRRELWLRSLRTYEVQIDYHSVLEKINSSQVIAADILHIIDMDVARSYQKNEQVDSQTLKNILKVFAYSYPAIGYCQGMNYIAGTLFLVIQDEAQSFKALFALVQKFKMTSLFNEKLKKLKKLFFILDRLISVFLPTLNETFKDAWVFSDNYSSGWFIALFGNVFISRIEILVQVWDLFLLQGWKGVFKVCLGILGRYQRVILCENFETILSELSNISTSEIFDPCFFSEVEKIKVTNSLIKEIKTQFRPIAN